MSDRPIIPDILAQNRFNAARREIERQPCLYPLRPVVWTTAEEMDRDRNKSWRDMGNGVFWMVGEYREGDGARLTGVDALRQLGAGKMEQYDRTAWRGNDGSGEAD